MKEYRNGARVACYDRHAWTITTKLYIYFNYSISLVVGIRVGVTVKVDSSVEA
jgi:hypothetical protein